MKKEGAIKEGDVFGISDERIIVQNFIKDDNDIFAHILIFKDDGFDKDDCISLDRLYAMRFIGNIMDKRI